MSRFLCVGISLENRQAVVDIAEQHDAVVASIGVHPLDVHSGLASVEELVEWSKHTKVVALGESGLDYHHLEVEGDKPFSKKVLLRI